MGLCFVFVCVITLAPNSAVYGLCVSTPTGSTSVFTSYKAEFIGLWFSQVNGKSTGIIYHECNEWLIVLCTVHSQGYYGGMRHQQQTAFRLFWRFFFFGENLQTDITEIRPGNIRTSCFYSGTSCMNMLYNNAIDVVLGNSSSIKVF